LGRILTVFRYRRERPRTKELLRDVFLVECVEAWGATMRALRLAALSPLVLFCAACAGRDPQPVATVQPTDAMATCAMIAAEIQANNIKVKDLAEEEGLKTGQNVAAGVAGVLIPVLWFGMDFKGAASKEVTALQARQQYLTTLATERCSTANNMPSRARSYAPLQ
jgi:hypothetical protein